jgi:hypothetical protein
MSDGRSDQIDWKRAVFGAAVLGGIAYGILARGFQIGEPVASGAMRWLPVGVATMAMLLCGFGLLYFANSGRLRTVAAAIAAAPATGGLIAFEIFTVWAVSQLV